MEAAAAIEPGCLISLVAALAARDGGGGDGDLERAGSLLWDLTADPGTCQALLQHGLCDALAARLAACAPQGGGGAAAPAAQQQQQQQQQGSAIHPARALELCSGMLANVAGHLSSTPGFEEQGVLRLLPALLALFCQTDDPPALAELCRLFAAALASPQGEAALVPLLAQPEHAGVLPCLLHIVSNTLNAPLLARALQLLAALLQPPPDGDGDDAPADENQQQQQEQQQQEQSLAEALWRAGLARTLSAVLEPAAAAAPACARPVAAAGGWDDDDDGPAADAAGAGSSSGSSGRLYRNADVLLALAAVLEQLGLQPSGADAALAALPMLPHLLLRLLAACAAAGQQAAAEALLPVLVMFRAAVVPLLLQQQQQQQHQQQCDVDEQQGGSCDAAAVEQQQQQPLADLHGLCCVADMLRDCGPHALDALDAGWFLCAAATRQLLQQAQHAQPSEQQLRVVARALSLAHVPESASSYALSTAQQLAALPARQTAMRQHLQRLLTRLAAEAAAMPGGSGGSG